MLACSGIDCRLCDTYGPKWLLCVGSVSYFLSLMLTAQCTQYWEFILAQGILIGIGSGTTYFPNFHV